MAEFLTVNLSSILKNQKSFADLDPVEQAEEASARQEIDISQISDWAKELKDRLAENRALGPSTRKSDYEIEVQFFDDYFVHGDSHWDENSAELLNGLGEPLKKAIKVLGFNKDVNPILGFLTDSYVLKNLLLTKLLNANTFKAIYTAVAKKLVADSELLTSNDYNIIYCQDLYRKPLAEIIKYLTLQKDILSPSASAYTKVDQDRNKKTFFKLTGIRALEIISKRYPEESYERYEKLKIAIEELPPNTELPSAEAQTTKLNDLTLANVLIGKVSSKTMANEVDSSSEQSSSAGVLANKIVSGRGNTKAQALAAIQYLSTTTDLPEAKAALKHDTFKNVSMEAFIAASAGVTKVMKETKLSSAEIKSFIALIMRRLERAV